MANPSKTLNCQFEWTCVVSRLGLNIPQVIVLPQRVQCPLCHSQQLTLTEDHLLGGTWANCRQCNFAGDLIELAAALWQVEVPAAVAKLDSLNLFPLPVSDNDVNAYMRDHILYRRRLNEFWETARQAPMQQLTPSTRILLRKFSLLDSTMSPMWLERGGRFIGSATCKAVEELFFPLSYDQQPRANHNSKPSVRRGGGPGNRRLFKGHGWEDVLVVPFSDLPGRICGFLFVGREADPDAGDILFKRANLGCNKQPVREAGVAMLRAIDDGPDRHFGDTIFVIANPIVGLLMQAQRARDSGKALPLVLSYFSQETQTLRLPPELEGRKLIFWGEHPQLLYQAKLHNGKVSRYRISHSEVQRRLNHHQALDWLRLIHRDAQHWRIALNRELRSLDLPGVTSLLERMSFSPAEMRDLIESSDENLRERLIASDPARIGHHRILVNGKTIVETDTGWIIEDSGEQICNMTLRIEQIATSNEGDCLYLGRATAKGQSSPFTITKKEIDRCGLFECVRAYLLEHDAGILIYQQRWEKHAECIALQFHQPELVCGVGRIGWQHKERCFSFPRFSISYGGEVKRELLPIPLAEHAPAPHLEPENILSTQKLTVLSAQSPETRLIWAVMACVAHNLIAPAINRKPYGVVLDGEQTASTGRVVARELGCGEIDLAKRARGQSVLEQIGEGNQRHGIPSVVRAPGRSRLSITAEWIDTGVLQNSIFSLEGSQALGVACQPEILRIHSPDPVSPLGELKQIVRLLLPSWLTDVCRRKLWINQVSGNHALDVLEDIAGWFTQCGGDPAAVLAASEILTVDSLDLAISFVGIIERLHQQGLIATARADFNFPRRKLPEIVYVPEAEAECGQAGVWVSALEINQVLVDQKCPAVNLLAVERTLRADNAWRGETRLKGLPGWLIDQGWFDAKLFDLRALRPTVDSLTSAAAII